MSSAESLKGYLAALVAVICYGSNFVFVKNIELSDGVFFQFCMCVAIWVTSIPVLLYVGTFPATTTEFSTAMTGGMLWCTGNMLCGPAVQLIGLSMGILLWGSTNMLMGWASGTFGLFGLTAETVDDPTLNACGVALAVIGLIFYLQVKPNENQMRESAPLHNQGPKDEYSYGALGEGGGLYSPLGDKAGIEEGSPSALDTNLGSREVSYTSNASTTSQDNSGPYYSTDALDAPSQWKSEALRDASDPFRSLSSTQRRLVGFAMALLAGILFGCSFDPSQYVIDTEDPLVQEDTVVFVFPQFSGILVASFTYTMIYCAYKRYCGEQPFVNSAILLPSFASGIFWGIATISWFVANQNLGFSVSFPIITSGPGFVGAMWGILKFNEISGKRNFTFLGTAFVITVAALVMVGVSHG